MFSSKSSPSDERYFELVAREIAEGSVRAGLWTRCMTDEQFDEKRAKTSYVKQRVREIKAQEASDNAAREKQMLLTSANAALRDAQQKLHELSGQEATVAPLLFRRTLWGTMGIVLGLLIGGGIC